MRKSLLTLLCGAVLPAMAMAQEMPTYCAGTAVDSYTHYGAHDYSIMVNGEEVLAIQKSEVTGNTGINDLSSTKELTLKPGDRLTFTLSAANSHQRWGHALVYIDWNGDGTFADNEMYTIYENVANDDLVQYVIGTGDADNASFSFTSTEPIVVPSDIVNGPVGMRFISGEAKRHHGGTAYDPCTRTARGIMVTVKANLMASLSFAVPQAGDYEHLSALTFTTADGTLAAGTTVTLPANTEITVNATPEAGYEIAGITVLDAPVANGGSFLLTSALSKDDIDIVVGHGKYALTLTNEANIPYTLTKTTGEAVTDLSRILEGTDLRLALDVPVNKLLTGVVLGDVVLHETDGAYTFTMPGNNVALAIMGREKQLFTVTIRQPEAGGTISVNGLKLQGEEFVAGELASGDRTLEGEQLALSFTRQPGYTFIKYTVNGSDLAATTVTVNSDVTISAVTEEGVEYPAMTRAFTNNLNQQNRYLKKVTTTGTETPVVFEVTATGDEALAQLPFTAYNGPVGTYVEDGAVVDKTANPIFVELGTQSFTYSFDVWSSAITTTINGSSATLSSEIGWTQFAYYVDWNRDGDFTDQGEYWTRETGNMTGSKYADTTTSTIQIPENVPAGVYRMRLVFNEPASSSTDWTLSIWDNNQLRNGVAYDFSICITPAEYENPRTVTIKADYPELGTVAFDDFEGTSVSTVNKSVRFTATPAEGAEMLNWTDDATNAVVSTTDSYVYRGEADASFTAHFGFALTYRVDGNGSLTATVGEDAIASGTALAPGTVVTFRAIPGEDHTLNTVLVNGQKVEFDENNSFTVTITAATEVKAVFVDAQYVLTIVTRGNGHYVAGIDATDDGMPTQEYVSGDLIGKNTDLYFAAVPDDGEEVLSITLTNNGATDQINVNTTNSFDDDEDDWKLSDGTVCFYAMAEGDMQVVVVFSENNGSIDGIDANDVNAPVEYFNLQGMKIEAKNLVPGMYIVRQGNKTAKQMIEK